MDGICTKQTAIERLMPQNLTDQYVFLTDASLKYLKFKGSEEILMKVDARVLDFFDRHVLQMIVEKYGINDKEAVRLLLESETYQMLLDSEQEIYAMSPRIVFDIWESEQITGNSRNSQYIRDGNNV